MLRWFFRLVFRLIALIFILTLVTAIYIVADGLDDHNSGADVGVILGNGVLPNGQPGRVLQERLDTALDQYRLGKVPLLVLSGGTGPNYSEPASMRRYLLAQSVPASVLIEDPHGFNTADTARDLINIMRARHLHSALIITHYYHITRTKWALRQAGVAIAGQAHAGVVRWGDRWHLLREVPALYYYMASAYLPVLKEKTEEIKSVIEKESAK